MADRQAPEGTTTEGYERVLAYLKEFHELMVEPITKEKIQRGMELARSYGLGTIETTEEGDVYFDMNDEARAILTDAFEEVDRRADQ